MADTPTLRPQPLVAEILPGFTTIVILVLAYGSYRAVRIDAVLSSPTTPQVLGAGFLILVSSWVVGAFLDALRDSLEHLWDCWWPVNWDFLFSGPTRQVKNLEESWLAYYYLSANQAVGFSIVLLAALCPALKFGRVGVAAVTIVLFLCLSNAALLRGEIRTLIGFAASRTLPHEAVYTRLAVCTPAPSTLFPERTGPCVGVVAIRFIPKGKPVFGADNDPAIPVRRETVLRLAPEMRKLYDDFCVLEGDFFSCPRNFNKLTPAWFPNDSDTPNIAPNDDLQFSALRDIQPGEEILARYADYDDAARYGSKTDPRATG